MKINVAIAQMQSVDKAIYSYVTELENLAVRLGKLHGVIDAKSYGKNTPAIKNKIEEYKKVVRKEKAIVNSLAVNLEKITVAYQNTEHDAISLITNQKFKKKTIKNNKVDADKAKAKTENTYKKSKLDQDLYKKTPVKPGKQKPEQKKKVTPGNNQKPSSGGQSAAKNVNVPISNKCLNLIKKFEGKRLEAYVCPAGHWTIGYGTTNADKSIIEAVLGKGVTVKSGLKITEAQAEQMLKMSIAKKYAPLVDKYNKKYHFTQNQYDALVSFAYNIGSIDQLTQNGTRTIAEISAKIPAYNKGNGKVMDGLVKRRAAEKALFDKK